MRITLNSPINHPTSNCLSCLNYSSKVWLVKFTSKIQKKNQKVYAKLQSVHTEKFLFFDLLRNFVDLMQEKKACWVYTKKLHVSRIKNSILMSLVLKKLRNYKIIKIKKYHLKWDAVWNAYFEKFLNFKIKQLFRVLRDLMPFFII